MAMKVWGIGAAIWIPRILGDRKLTKQSSSPKVPSFFPWGFRKNRTDCPARMRPDRLGTRHRSYSQEPSCAGKCNLTSSRFADGEHEVGMPPDSHRQPFVSN